MNLVNARNVHQAIPQALMLLGYCGVRRDSRYGGVTVSPEPVTTRYDRPLERVVFHPERDAHPFLHFADAMWCLSGRNDIATLVRFAKRMAEFSDDGVTHHGAYGRRWRERMPIDGGGVDQLQKISAALVANPDDRRQVLQIWDAASDLGHGGRDVPCNVTATFQVGADGRLNLVVFNRSNDIVWGCYGANAVQFSYLLEYVASRARLPVGTYHQVSVNWHGYDATYPGLAEKMGDRGVQPCPYELGEVRPYPLMHACEDVDAWDGELRRLMGCAGRAPLSNFREPFFAHVAVPILQAHDAYKDGAGESRFELALEILLRCQATDWRRACSEWIVRRWNNYRKDADDGPAAY